MPSTSNILAGTNPSIHMVTWVGVRLHGVVTPRSWQGHIKVTGRSNHLKNVENSLFCCFLLQLCSLEITMMV